MASSHPPSIAGRSTTPRESRDPTPRKPLKRTPAGHQTQAAASSPATAAAWDPSFGSNSTLAPPKLKLQAHCRGAGSVPAPFQCARVHPTDRIPTFRELQSGCEPADPACQLKNISLQASPPTPVQGSQLRDTLSIDPDGNTAERSTCRGGPRLRPGSVVSRTGPVRSPFHRLLHNTPGRPNLS